MRHPRPRPGGSPRSIASPESPSDPPSGREARRRASGMRALLEFLGIVAPDRTRREPVVLPTWARWAVPALPVALALLFLAVYAVIRFLLS